MDVRKLFPFYNDPSAPLYFDSACMTLKTIDVIQASTHYYEKISSCHSRSVHHLGELTSYKVDEARLSLGKFFNVCSETNIVFTKNTTEAINLVALGYSWERDDIVLTLDSEHNSNLIPWIYQQKNLNLRHQTFPVNPDQESFDFNALEDEFKKNKIKMLSMPLVSHLTGMVFPFESISNLCKKHNVLFMLDAAQGLTTHAIDWKKTSPDFLVGSMHKMFGPTGVGFLVARNQHLEKIKPLTLGGHTVTSVVDRDFTLANIPDRFESGLQNYASLCAVKSCLDFFKKFSQKQIYDHCLRLNKKFNEGFSHNKKIQILGPKDSQLRPTLSNLIIPDGNIEEISKILDKSYSIIARNGVHCSHAWYNKYKLAPSLRFSFSIYNTNEEIDELVKAIEDVTYLL